MRAMILAAGRGERMRPLTDVCPKPLLDVAGTPLIGWHLKRLAAAGITEIVINHAWLGEKLEAALCDGQDYGVQISWSAEGAALETAGGIAHALPLLGDAPFLVVNGDIFCDFDFSSLASIAVNMAQPSQCLAHLVLVPNPAHHPAGDFGLDAAGKINRESGERLTFSGIGIYHPALFAGIEPGQSAKLGALLIAAAAQGRVSGQIDTGIWLDVGTVERLDLAREIAATL